MPSIGRILFPTDFSERAQVAWSYAKLMSETFSAQLCLLHVLQEPAAMVPEASIGVAPPAVNLGELTQFAEDALDRLQVDPPGSIGSRSVRNGPPAAEIVRFAQELEADLIVLGTHGRTGFAHALLGSVAERVVRKAPCAVMTIRPHSHGAD